MKQVSFLLSMIRGAIGKEFVVKHYGRQVILTRYPNMEGIKPSRKQKQRRSLFKKAVLYAQNIYADPLLKEEKRRLLRRPKRLFQALMKEWFKQYEDSKARCEKRISVWQKNYALNRTFRTAYNQNYAYYFDPIALKDLSVHQERLLKYNSFSPK